MLSGITQTATKFVLGAVGVTALYNNAAVVVLLAQAVGKVFNMGIDQIVALSGDKETKKQERSSEGKKEWSVRDLIPTTNKDWTSIATSAAINIVSGTVCMYILNRFFPSVVADANTLLHRAVSIQFTPNHIPLVKLAGF